MNQYYVIHYAVRAYHCALVCEGDAECSCVIALSINCDNMFVFEN
jgi:hypothetical protein